MRALKSPLCELVFYGGLFALALWGGPWWAAALPLLGLWLVCML